MSAYKSSPYMWLPYPAKKMAILTEPAPVVQAPTLAERRGYPWYKKLSLSIRSNGKSSRSSMATTSAESPVKSLEEYLNKPLPALPSPEQPPYFEYMFSEAGMKLKKSDEATDSSSETSSIAEETHSSEPSENETRATTVSNISAQSYGLESSEITQFAFAHAGVHVSTKEVIDNHFASLGTSLEGQLDVERLAEDIEKEKASEQFFGGVTAKEGPTPNHLPVVDGEGFVDRRSGLEQWPSLWQPDKHIDITSTVESGSSDDSTVPNNNALDLNQVDGNKHILQPKSRKPKTRLQDPYFPDSHTNVPVATLPQTIATAVQHVHTQSPVRAPRPLTIRKKNTSVAANGGPTYRVNKRGARDSFVTKSTFRDAKPDDFSITLGTTKKIRVAQTLVSDQDINNPSRAVSVCGSINTPSSVDLTLQTPATSPITPLLARDADQDVYFTDASLLTNPEDYTDTHSLLSLKRHRLTDHQTGYPGQFASHEADTLHERAALGGKAEHHTSGSPNHANGLFTHRNFIKDPTYPAFEYTKRMLSCLPDRELALLHADQMTTKVSCCAVRTPTQELLRREIQRECASARLEGVSIGEYRYYQGFMNLEEYVGAKFCVCWRECFCSKLCGRYGDVQCPCSEWIEIHGDD